MLLNSNNNNNNSNSSHKLRTSDYRKLSTKRSIMTDATSIISDDDEDDDDDDDDDDEEDVRINNNTSNDNNSNDSNNINTTTNNNINNKQNRNNNDNSYNNNDNTDTDKSDYDINTATTIATNELLLEQISNIKKPKSILRLRTILLATVDYGVLAMGFVLFDETLPLFLKLNQEKGGMSFDSSQIGKLQYFILI